MSSDLKTRILIPGNWKDQEEFVTSLARQTKCLFAGFIILDSKTGNSFTAQFIEDWTYENYVEEFPTLFSDENPNEMPSVCSMFVIDGNNGSLEELQKLCHIVSEVLKISDYGIKILNAVKVVPKVYWNKVTFSLQTIFDLFVSVYEIDEGMITCGMSNFGQRDVTVPLKLDDDGLDFIRTFAWYVVNEQPKISEGDTFSSSEDEPVFEIFEKDDLRDSEYLLHNPYGLWQVVPQEYLDDEI